MRPAGKPTDQTSLNLGPIPAGVRTSDLDTSGNFLNIPKKGQGDLNLSARRDHDVLGVSNSLHSKHVNQSMSALGFNSHTILNQSQMIGLAPQYALAGSSNRLLDQSMMAQHQMNKSHQFPASFSNNPELLLN